MNNYQKLIFLVFLLYKTSESLFQPSIRIFVYETVISMLKSKNRTAFSRLDKTNLVHYQFGNAAKMENEVQKTAANFIIAYRALINIPAAILTIYWGGWSDRFGRKIPLVLPCIGAVLSCTIFAFALLPHVYGTLIAIGIVMTAVLVYGVFGKSSLITMSCNSYVVDCTSSEERTTLLSRLLGMNFFGIFVGSFLVGIIAKYSNFSSVLITISCTCALLVLIIIFAIPETINAKKETGSEANEETCLTKSEENTAVQNNLWRFITRSREGENRKYLIWLICAMFWNQTAKAGEQDVILLYVKHSPMSWSNELYGYYLATYYGCMGIVLTFVMPFIERIFHPSDTLLIMIGISMKSLRLILMGSTYIKWQLFFAAIVGSAAGMTVAVIKSLMSKLCEDDEIGITFAITSSLESISGLIGPTIFTLLYQATIDVYIGTIFYVDACLQLCFLIGFVKLHLYMDGK